MAESKRPLNFCGGNVIGTRRMVLSIFWSPSSFQNGSLLRFISTELPDNGRRSLPSSNTRRGPCTLADESSGTYDFMFRFRKSKILCFAGLTPVAKVDQATGESEGNVVRS